MTKFKADRLAQAMARIQAKKEQREEQLWSNDDYVDREAKESMSLSAFERLQEIEQELKVMYTNGEVHINNQVVVYQDLRAIKYFGPELAVLTRVLSNSVYAIDQLKDDLCQHTGVNELLGQKALRAIGNTSYWSNRQHMVVESSPFSIELAEFYLPKVLERMGISDLDITGLTEQAQATRYRIEDAKAETKLNMYNTALAQFELEGEALV
jgi:hypothetical protein